MKEGSRFFFRLVFICMLGAPTLSHAETNWFFSPAIGFGTNSAQKVYFRLGADIGLYLDENLYAGVGGYYAAGSHPEHDREIGGGPFVGYSYPVTPFLIAGLRQDILYVDQYNPEELSNGLYTHSREDGVASSTYAGLHLRLGDHLGFSVGYRLVVGLTNADLADGRSGPAFGVGIGF